MSIMSIGAIIAELAELASCLVTVPIPVAFIIALIAADAALV